MKVVEDIRHRVPLDYLSLADLNWQAIVQATESFSVKSATAKTPC